MKVSMKRHLPRNAQAGESAALLTAALVLTLVGVVSSIELNSWVVTSTLFILAAAAGVGGLVVRHTR
jgi:hypothetical protein